MRFLSTVLATIVGLFTFIFVGILFIVIIGLASGSSSPSTAVEENTVITLDLNQVHDDYAGKFVFKDFGYTEEEEAGFIDILNAIETAKNDSKIKGISILNSAIELGMAQSKSLRDKLIDFKTSGKFIVSYSNTFSQKDYYLNSVADTIYLNPVGELEFKGLASEVLYYKDFQEKSGVKMEIIRHGKYKSAVEPYLKNEMSPENREQITAILQSVWDVVVSDVSKSRNINPKSLNTIAENLDAQQPQQALAVKLIDKIAYEDEYHNGIKKATNTPKDEDYKTISILKYASNQKTKQSTNTETIAVVYAQGVIWGGEGDESYIGEQSIKRALGGARKNEDIKAVVLRVDSPGGSALTSELIWREIELTRKTKPVIVSMGNVAASGGYYIACGANRIFAEPNTITGSIGVFGQIPNISNLTQKMGITSQFVQTHANAANYSPFQPLQDNYKNAVTQSIESIYSVFLKRVADGRKMSITQVDSIAQGRVWVGKDALKNGLVDEIGGLDKAIDYAAKISKTKSYKVVNYPEYYIDFKDYVSGLVGFPVFESTTEVLKKELGEENYQLLKHIQRINSRKGIQTIMPYELEIR